MHEQPQLAAAEMGRLADDETYRVRRAAGARSEAERQTFTDVAHELEEIYQDVRTRKRSARRDAEPLGDRDWIVVDLHMHTSASHDCRVAPELLLEQRWPKASARSRSRTTTSSPARRRCRSSRAAATSSSSPARR